MSPGSREALTDLAEMLEDAPSKNGGWTLVGDSLVFHPGGHLTPVHTSALRSWAEAVRRVLEAE